MRKSLLAASIAACFSLAPQAGIANPTGGTVVAGSASFAAAGSTLTVTNSANTIIHWQGFSIGINEITRFLQSSASSAVLNRVVGANGAIPQSVIDGVLQSNGRVFLLNPMGVVIGPGARIDVAGLVASSLNLSNDDFLAGRMRFTEVPGAGGIANHGIIESASGGRIFLVAPSVENSGVIRAPQGEIILAAGKSAELVSEASPLVTVRITADSERALNVGSLIAESGRVGMFGALVRNSGVAEASAAVAGPGGQIRFVASKDLTLDAGSRTAASGTSGGEVFLQAQDGTNVVAGSVEAKGTARAGGTINALGLRVGVIGQGILDASGESGGGTVLVGGDYRGANPEVQNSQRTYIGPDGIIRADASTTGDGGRVIVWSDGDTGFYGHISARGGAQSGNGGFVETSGKRSLKAFGTVDTAAPGGQSGSWLLDPTDLYVVAAAPANSDGELADGWILAGDPLPEPSEVSASAIEGFAGNVTLEATNDVKFQTGLNKGNGGLWVSAGNNIDLNSNVISVTGPIDMTAGGSINSTIDRSLTQLRTNGGSVDLDAGSGITVGGVDTTGGTSTDTWVYMSAGGDLLTGAITTGNASGIESSANSSVRLYGNTVSTLAITTGSATSDMGDADSRVYILAGGAISTGPISTGAADASASLYYGNAYSKVELWGGDVTVNGAVSTASATANYGDADSGVYVTADGAVNIAGGISTAAALTNEAYYYGAYSKIDVQGGAITVNGTLGTGSATAGYGDADSGVYLDSSGGDIATGGISTGAVSGNTYYYYGAYSKVEINSAGAVTVSGSISTGGANGVDSDADSGIYISAAGTVQTGALTTGAAAVSSSYYGSYSAYSKIDVWGSAGVTVNGALATGGATSFDGSAYASVYLEAESGAISAGAISTGAATSYTAVGLYADGMISAGDITTSGSEWGSTVRISSSSSGVSVGAIRTGDGAEGFVQIDAYGNVVVGAIQTGNSSYLSTIDVNSTAGGVTAGDLRTGASEYDSGLAVNAAGALSVGAIATGQTSCYECSGGTSGSVALIAGSDIATGPITTRGLAMGDSGGMVAMASAGGRVFVNGNIDTRGADGGDGAAGYLFSTGGDGGNVALAAATTLEVRGGIFTQGGNGVADYYGAGAAGGAGGSVALIAAQSVIVGPPALVNVYPTVIDTSGGAGGAGSPGGAGGNAGSIYVDPVSILFNGSVIAVGGAGYGAPGGSGGYLGLYTTNGTGTITFINGGYDVTGGLGSPPGANGIVTADGTLILISLLNQDPFQNPAVAQSISSTISEILTAQPGDANESGGEQDDKKKKTGFGSCKR